MTASTTQTQSPRLAGVDYPSEQDLSIFLGAVAVIAVATLIIVKWSRRRP